jgi:hypothetical protein
MVMFLVKCHPLPKEISLSKVIFMILVKCYLFTKEMFSENDVMVSIEFFYFLFILFIFS